MNVRPDRSSVRGIRGWFTANAGKITNIPATAIMKKPVTANATVFMPPVPALTVTNGKTAGVWLTHLVRLAEFIILTVLVRHRPLIQLYYEDGTCLSAENHDTSKTVLGIVVYVTDDGQHGQIMAPWFVDQNGNKSSSGVAMEWGPYGDVPGLPNITRDTQAEADFDSCGNTDKIAAAGNASTYPAAWATRKYAPTTATSGKWCLPAAGVLRNIQKNWVTIYTAVNTVGGADIENSRVWSSSEHAGNDAWQAILSGGDLYFIYKYGIIYYVVPVLEF